MDSPFMADSDVDHYSFTSCPSTSDTGFSSARSSLSYSLSDLRHCSGLNRQSHRGNDPCWTPVRAIRVQDGAVDLRHVKVVRHLGSGDAGKVFLCRLRGFEAGPQYALKVVDRDALAARGGWEKVAHVHTESQLLGSFDHPFLPSLYAQFEDSRRTFFLIDYCSGGDLHSLMRRQPKGRFDVRAARFFGAETLVALEYLHSRGVVYRDLKPENILRKEDGHIMLSDFDLSFIADVTPRLEMSSRVVVSGKRNRHRLGLPEFIAEPTSACSRACVGTHEYLAPEIITGKGHGNGVDWWAFGIFLFEMIYGYTPFKGRSKDETLRNILVKPLRFPVEAIDRPELFAATDLISRLLVKDSRRRLGSTRGATDVKKHAFFASIRWPLIRTYVPPRFEGDRRRKRVSAKVKKVSIKGRWSWRKVKAWLSSHVGINGSVTQIKR